MTPPRDLRIGAGGRLSNRVFLDDPQLTRLLGVLNDEGEEARVVGGAVRNALIGLRPGDIDVTTTARPDAVIARARKAHFRTIPTGIAHGTVTVVVAGSPFEVTTLREDIETDGRHAVVKFGRDFSRDAQRRDFTINALSVDAEGRVHDDTGGLYDLAAGRVRFIGDADARIREDYLRILRFFRFSALYAEGPLDPDGLAAAIARKDGLDMLSRERVRVEMLKLLAARHAAPVVMAMGEAGLLDAVLRKPCWPDRFERLSAIQAARRVEPDPILGLAALAIRDQRDAAGLRDALRLSNEERDRLERVGAVLCQSARDPDPPKSSAVAILLFAEGRRTAVDIITLLHVESGAAANDPRWMASVHDAETAQVPTLPVSGADVLASGVRSGPMVGRILKHLQAAWIRAGFPDHPVILRGLLDEAIRHARSGGDTP